MILDFLVGDDVKIYLLYFYISASTETRNKQNKKLMMTDL